MTSFQILNREILQTICGVSTDPIHGVAIQSRGSRMVHDRFGLNAAMIVRCVNDPKGHGLTSRQSGEEVFVRFPVPLFLVPEHERSPRIVLVSGHPRRSAQDARLFSLGH